MKRTINKITKITAVLSFLLCFVACEKEGDTLYLSGHENNELTVSDTEIVLTQGQAAQVVLSMTWTTSTLAISDPTMYAPEAESIYIQISDSADFSGTVLEAKEINLSKAYTGSELNAVAKNLSFEPEKRSLIFIRLRSSIGENMESKYSNVKTVAITPYEIDMSVGFILTSDGEDTGLTLRSPESNGVYSGFMGAPGWYNFRLKEGDGVTWGGYPVDGNAFKLGSSEDESTPWTAWFPEPGGCYFVEFNTNSREWSALYIPELNISGDLQQAMEFSRSEGKWTSIFNATAAGNITIQLSATGKQYNYTTGTDDAKAVATPVGFAGTSEKLSFGKTSSGITVTVPEAGEYTLVVDLKNPDNWTVSVQSGGEEPEPVYQELYLTGIDDGINGGNWTFDNLISLYDEDEKKYLGIVNVNSLWGYKMAIEKDNWNDNYTLAEGDAYAGSLVYQGTDNIPSPDPGMYIIEASLKELTYKLTLVGSQIWVMGVDGNYSFDKPLTATGEPGVYSGQITTTEAPPYGLEIQLDNSWNFKFGGTDGVLYFKGDNIKDAILNTPGTYTVTVNLLQKTYSIQ